MNGGSNTSVAVTYEKYYLRKVEIAKNILLIAICDMERDGLTPDQHKKVEESGMTKADEILSEKSSFNIGQIDSLITDYEECFKKVEDVVQEVANNL